MEKYPSLPTIRIIFTVYSWDLNARSCPSQDSLAVLRISVGFQLTNKRNSMAHTTWHNEQAGNIQQGSTKRLLSTRVAAGEIRLRWQNMCS